MAEPSPASIASPSAAGVFGVVVVLLGGFLWWAPSSPLALGLADATSATDAGHAVERYDAIAESSFFASAREQALWRAATLLAVDLRDPEGARSRYRQLASHAREPEVRGRAYAAMGRLLRDAERRPTEAALAFEDAVRVHPESDEAVTWLSAAARSHAVAGNVDAADDAWLRLAREYPESRPKALVARGNLRLSQDDTSGALRLYRMAQEIAEGDTAAVAALGAATCLERLGNLDEALAELDAADIPGAVREARAGGIRARIGVESNE